MYGLAKLKPPKQVRLPVASKGKAKPASPGIDPYESWTGSSSAPSSASANPYDITTDPGYQAALLAQKTGRTNISDSLLEVLRQDIIRFGDPSMADAVRKLAASAGFGFDFGSADTSAASSNPYSTLATLGHSHELRQRALINHLAATGGIFSGDTGYQTGEENNLYGGQVYTARQALLDAISKSVQDSIERQNALQAATDAAAQAAWSRGVQSYA